MPQPYATKKKKRKDLTKFQINHIAAVDRGAQASAGRVLLKRDDTPHRKDDGNLGKRAALTTTNEDHNHLITLDTGSGELTSGQTSWDQDHVHNWVMGADGNITIAEARAFSGVLHSHERGAMSKRADGEPAGDTADPPESSSDTTANSTADQIGEETGMAKEGQDAATEKAAELKKVQDERDAALAKAERAEKVLALPGKHRAYLLKLEKAEQDKFLAADEATRTTEVDAALAKAADSNPIVYTSKTTGTAFRKNDGQHVIELAKQNDELAGRLAKSENDREQQLLEKRAKDELPHLKGTDLAKAALLKAVDGIPHEALRKEITELLAAQDLGMADLTKRRGTSAAPATDAGSPLAKFNELAKRYATDKSVTIEAASVAILDTPEGVALYNESVDPEMARNGQ